MFRPILRRHLLGALAAVPALRLAAATSLPAPAERVVLTLDGDLAGSNTPDGSLRLDMPTLESIGLARITTTTPWFDSACTFEGVPMDTLMQAAGARGAKVVARALNDYVTEIPIEDFRRHGVILATRRDGQRMPVRDKGPLFVIYPFDSNRSLWNERYFARSAWSVARLTVR